MLLRIANRTVLEMGGLDSKQKLNARPRQSRNFENMAMSFYQEQRPESKIECSDLYIFSVIIFFRRFFFTFFEVSVGFIIVSCKKNHVFKNKII